MARKNAPKITPIIARERVSREKHSENLRYLSRKGWKGDPTNKRAVAASAAEYRARDTIERRYSRPVSSREARLLKEHGFHVSKHGALIDSPRKRAYDDPKRGKVPGARFKVQDDGTVKFSTKQRRDYVVGFTKQEKKDFDSNPKETIDRILARLRKKNAELKRSRKVQTRLQWGAFESRKDFSPLSYVKKLDTMRKIATWLRRKYGPRVKTPLDNLTGVHFVIHTQKTKR